MSLPIAQHRVLAYLAECSPSGTGDIARALRMNRDKVRGALSGLIHKGLASADSAAYPVSFEITEQGRKQLAEPAPGDSSKETTPMTSKAPETPEAPERVQPNPASQTARCEHCKQFVIYCRCY